MNANLKPSAQRGSTIIEFALIAFLLMLVIFAGFEFDRMVLSYTSIANAAKAGVRYAIVHGNNRSGGSGADGQSGATDSSQVVAVVRRYASTGMLNTSAVSVDVQYPASASSTDPGNFPGSAVVVTVTYPYDPFVVALPLRVNLRSSAQGIIVF